MYIQALLNDITINGVLTNDLLTSSINTISSNINIISGNINTISGGLNKLQTYIGINTTSAEINLNCNKIYYTGLNIIKTQTEFTNNIAFQRFINQIL